MAEYDARDRQETSDRIARVLMQLSWLTHKRFAQHVSRHGLTLPQYLTLRFLIKHQSHCAMTQLAEATRQDAATMTGVIDRLERLDLVERRRNPLDRRVVLVRPTQEAMDLLHTIQRSRQALMEQLFEPFDNEEMDTLLSMLDRLLESVEQSE